MCLPVVVKERMHDMAQEEDYYAILGIDKSASQDDIQKAYRSMAKNGIQMSITIQMPLRCLKK